jgi:YD repeat-containing protein
MNRIILIGNGFDLAHGLKTSYGDFINWFWGFQRHKINETNSSTWDMVSGTNYRREYRGNNFFTVKFPDTKGNIEDFDIKETKPELDTPKTEESANKRKNKFTSRKDLKDNIVCYKNKFLELIDKKGKIQNWVDIEVLYFEILCNCKDRYKQSKNIYEVYTVEQLNRDFKLIKDDFEEFLRGRNNEIKKSYQPELQEKINELINRKAIIKADKYKESDKNCEVGDILLLNFNYTKTISELYEKDNRKEIALHGKIDDSKNPVIFGYSDEVSSESTEMEDLEINGFLENIKSIQYVKTDNYDKLTRFRNDGEYDVYIFGISCGNADRTLLRELFEHDNCKSIRNFYYYDEKTKTDNFDEIVDNIYRKFKDKATFRWKFIKKDGDGSDKNDALPQFVGNSPFKDKDYPDDKEETQKQVKEKFSTEKPTDKTDGQNDIEKFKNREMIFVEGDKEKSIENFYIGRCQVTQYLWKTISGNNPSYFKGDKLPVENVSWYDAVEFCNRLSKKYGMDEYYRIDGNDVRASVGANGFRLPTDSEWEYAAKGGNKTQNKEYSGCDRGELKDYAWYYENSGDTGLKDSTWNAVKLNKNNCRTHNVGEKKANELGIHDMSGNVWEWCWDLYDKSGSHRVLRGGSWRSRAGRCQVVYRGNFTPDDRTYRAGFRLVLPQ